MQKENETVDALQAELALQRKKVELILAIDHIRDKIPDPPTMLSAIASLLADHFEASLCFLCLRDRETGDLELKAVNDRSRHTHPQQLDALMTRTLAQQIIKADDVIIGKDHISLHESLQEQLPDDIQLAGVPIIMGETQRLGAVLLARLQRPFDEGEIELLKVAESQIDSAVMQGYAHYDIQQRNKELETIYRVDRIRDQHMPFDEMLGQVLQTLRGVIDSEMGFVMLYQKDKLKLQAATDDDLFQVSQHYAVVDRIAGEALRKGDVVCRNGLGDVLRSMLCIPLILRDEIIGVLGVVNSYHPRGFRSADQRLLRAIGSQMDTAIFESLERQRLRQVLGRSVDPQVMERLLANPDVDFLKGERLTLTVLYADLRGSTSMSERADEPELLVGFVNDYLGRMTEVILSHEGTLDKFVGDEVMALFGAPFPQPDHALRAAAVGLEMQKAHQEVMADWRVRNFEPAPVGVGVATGEMVVGEMGCAQRTDYTVIGRAANLGARICSAARPGQVLISQETYDLIQDQVAVSPIRGLNFKGLSGDVDVYQVIRILE
jgi:adenylate cyclase